MSRCECGCDDKHGEWISVKDRLPEKSQFCLAWCGDSGRWKEVHWLLWNSECQNWTSLISRDWGEKVYEVTHWIPLPDGPGDCRCKCNCGCEKVEIRQCENCRHWDKAGSRYEDMGACSSSDYRKQLGANGPYVGTGDSHSCGWWEKCKCKEIPIPFHMQNDQLCFYWEEGDCCTSKVWPRKAHFSCEFINWLNQLWRRRT